MYYTYMYNTYIYNINIIYIYYISSIRTEGRGDRDKEIEGDRDGDNRAVSSWLYKDSITKSFLELYIHHQANDKKGSTAYMRLPKQANKVAS